MTRLYDGLTPEQKAWADANPEEFLANGCPLIIPYADPHASVIARQEEAFKECQDAGMPAGYNEHHPEPDAEALAQLQVKMATLPILALLPNPRNLETIRATCNQSMEIEEVFQLIELLQQDIKPRVAAKIEQHAEIMRQAETDLQRFQQLNYRLINP